MKIKKSFMSYCLKCTLSLSVFMCALASRGICFFIYHESEFPDELRKY